MARQKEGEDREKEHDRAVRNGIPDVYAAAVHCLIIGHRKESCVIVKQVNNSWKLDAWESLYILNERERGDINEYREATNSKLFKFARKNK
jgi:hypothetical protein